MQQPGNHAAWIYAFAGWLTARDEPVTIGSNNDCGEVARLCGEYCKAEGLDEPLWEKVCPQCGGRKVLPDLKPCLMCCPDPQAEAAPMEDQ